MSGTAHADEAAAGFDPLRPMLLRLGYRMLGSVADAEDVVQEAFIRWMRSDRAEVREPEAFLRRTVTRLCLDQLKSAQHRRETYVGPWLPEPIVEEEDEEDVTLPLMLALERLSPLERAAFLLHDVFSMTFEEVAEVVGRTPAAVRQLASRARRHVAAGRPRFPPTPQEQRALVEAFAAACQGGDLDALTRLLDPDVVCRGDGGGKVSAVPGEVLGADQVARLLLSFTRGARLDVRVATVNGMPGLVLRAVDDVLSVASFTVDGGRITSVDVIRNPDKLAYVSVPD